MSKKNEIDELIMEIQPDSILFEQLKEERIKNNEYRQLIKSKNTKHIEFLLSLPFNLLIEILLKATPTSRTSILSEYYRRKMGLIKSDDIDRGDAKDVVNNKYTEQKITIIDGINLTANFVQTRPWQNVDYFYVIIDVRDNSLKEYIFMLTSEQMNEELKQPIVSNSHGTKKANLNNANKELSIRFRIDNNLHFDRWKNNYLLKYTLFY